MNNTTRLVYLANAIQSLSWAEMVKVSEHIVVNVPHLQKSGSLDRDGMAQTLTDMASGILREREFEKSKGGDDE